MEKQRSTILILVGIIIAVLSAFRSVPDLASALTLPLDPFVQERETARMGEGAQGALSPILHAARPELPVTVSADHENTDLLSTLPGISDTPADDLLVLEAGPGAEKELSDPGAVLERSVSSNPTNRQEPAPSGEKPVQLEIASIGLAAPVLPAQTSMVSVDGQEFKQWLAPDAFAAGWHDDSALLGLRGNTVLNGHHNIFGEVFRGLIDVQIGDEIILYSDTRAYKYLVTNKMILPEKYEQIDVRMENARWIMPSPDERLTLITCWPYESNTHRLILVGTPIRLPENLTSSTSQGE